MQNKHDWPHGFLLGGIALFIAACFVTRHTTDVHLHDTYFIVHTAHLLAATGVWFLLCWLLYLPLRRRKPWAVLTALHLLLSLLFAVVMFVAPLLRHSPRHYVDFSAFQNDQQAIFLATLDFVLGQVLFLVNVVMALVRRRSN